MTNDSFLQTLEGHFTTLNQLVHQSLVDLVRVHQETLEKYTANRKALQHKQGADLESENAIKHSLAFHKANQLICNSLYTGITDDSPLTGMLTDLETELARIMEADIPGEQLRERQVYRQFLLPLYLDRVSELILDLRQELSRSMSVFWEDELKPVPEFQWEENYASLLVNFYRENQEAYGQILARSGTPFSFTGLKIWSRRGSSKRAFSRVEYLERSWRITFYALFEDWRFREQLFAFIHEVRLLKLEVSSIFSARMRTRLYPELEKQNVLTSRLLAELPDPENASMEDLRSYLVKELYRLNKEKKKQEQEQENTASGEAEGILGILQKLESVIQEKLQEFPPKVGVVHDPDYEKGIKQSEIRYFSPSEFLEFSSMAEFIHLHQKLKAELRKVLEKIVREFKEFDQIIDFYLDSAIALTEKPGIREEEVVGVFREGISRLEGICQTNRNMLGVLEQQKWFEVSANTEAFIDSVRKLDDNDNVFNIYTHLLKSKALASSVQNKRRLISGLKKFTAWISRFSSEHLKWLKASYEDIRKRLKLTSSSATITSEISNYLAGTRKHITRLPVIYQHLFESAPVKELNLFLKRENDTGRLDRALADWERGNFAATLVSGETGSGCSSLLQYYAKSLKSQYPILSFQVDNFYSSAEDYYSLINEIFGQHDIRDEASLAQFVSTLSDKIVIVDGIERMFMRMVNGFECLRKFLAFVVKTDDKIFWICSVSKIAFHYLNRTVALSEHFDYILDLDNLNASDIREIIMKRNRLSGYGVIFMPSLEEAEKNTDQEELEEEFFNDLDRAAGSNIGLSLVYWLQSVDSIGEDGIKVRRFSLPDLDFLDNLPARKTFVLLLVILHGKISEEYLTLLSNSSPEDSSGLLSMLKEDSILVRQDEYFILNGILYRHVVKLLKDRNLIH
jgi:hypothetical protein